LAQNPHGALAAERPDAAHHLVRDHAERVEIRAPIDGLPQRLLGSHVFGRAEDHADLGDRRGGALRARRRLTDGHLGDAEIEHFREVWVARLLDEHHVLGLQIPMHDVERVGAGQGRRDLTSNVQRAFDTQRPGGDLIAQVFALNVLEDEKYRAIAQLTEISRGGDIRVIDVGRRHGLALEALHDFRHRRQLAVQHLDRETFAHEHVLGGIDAPHPALTEQRIDAIAVGEHGADTRIVTARNLLR
jgi:hypothetical protein